MQRLAAPSAEAAAALDSRPRRAGPESEVAQAGIDSSKYSQPRHEALPELRRVG
jgi:hypothetical protein